ncbi:MAG: helix-turn-helix domain-containing protein [Paludibacteraceae bacterium]
MTYEKLKCYAKDKCISIKEIARQIDMTPNGLKFSIENDTLPSNKIKILCDLLQITPNEFFDNTHSPAISQQAHHIQGNVKQVAHLNTGSTCTSCIEKDREIHELQAELIKLYRKNNK